MSTIDIRANFLTPTVDSEPFWAACDREVLSLQRCTACERFVYYARRLCPHCGESNLSWEPTSGKGTIFSHSEVRVSFFGPDWQDQLPYTVALIDLAEGPRMLSRLLLKPDQQARIGDEVEVSFVEVRGRKFPFFKL
ncbi:Zn-ribbon domain-containing OB-fold protein [Parapusillimonas sp. JC17]|uniref:Zn-ribbon domain-containing OB-fold protein n=1 Tax=Parapusillimonas sp. JC17 TaxID=3445768 RepID=UPI003F9F79FB